MNRKNYSKKTIESYLKSIYDVLKASGKDIYHLTSDDFNEFINDAIITFSISYVNQAISAGKLFYLLTGKQPLKFKHIEYPRAKKHLPKVI